MGPAFLGSLMVAMFDEFYRGMSKIWKDQNQSPRYATEYSNILEGMETKTYFKLRLHFNKHYNHPTV